MVDRPSAHPSSAWRRLFAKTYGSVPPQGMISAPALQDEVERLRRALKDVEAELAAAQVSAVQFGMERWCNPLSNEMGAKSYVINVSDHRWVNMHSQARFHWGNRRIGRIAKF